MIRASKVLNACFIQLYPHPSFTCGSWRTLQPEAAVAVLTVVRISRGTPRLAGRSPDHHGSISETELYRHLTIRPLTVKFQCEVHLAFE